MGHSTPFIQGERIWVFRPYLVLPAPKMPTGPSVSPPPLDDAAKTVYETRMEKPLLLGTLAISLFVSTGCASSPAAPFDTLKTANLTAFRLQNYEPPPSATPTAAGAIPGMPNEIQAWIQQGAAGLQQLIPPGLLPPGLIPQQGQATPGATPTTPTDQVPRFHNFRILSQTQVIDEDLKDELAKILGDDGNFDNNHANCMYAEMGLSFSSGGPANDVLISFSCNQVNAATFAWPHPATGMKPKTVQKLSEVVQKLWPPGT